MITRIALFACIAPSVACAMDQSVLPLWGTHNHADHETAHISYQVDTQSALYKELEQEYEYQFSPTLPTSVEKPIKPARAQTKRIKKKKFRLLHTKSHRDNNRFDEVVTAQIEFKDMLGNNRLTDRKLDALIAHMSTKLTHKKRILYHCFCGSTLKLGKIYDLQRHINKACPITKLSSD